VLKVIPATENQTVNNSIIGRYKAADEMSRSNSVKSSTQGGLRVRISENNELLKPKNIFLNKKASAGSIGIKQFAINDPRTVQTSQGFY
jgi:hypothetical protein